MPINQIILFLSKIKKVSKNKFLIMDIGSTKLKIIEAADRLRLNFIGTHPLAGSEKKGMDFSCHKLFEKSKVIITPTKKTNKLALKKIRLLWKKLDADIVTLSPREHDKILAYTSHLPHLISFGLIGSIPKKYLHFGASGLKDTTRIASSDVQIWTDILLNNKKNLLNSLKSFQQKIKRLKKAINKNKRTELTLILNTAKNKRESIN